MKKEAEENSAVPKDQIPWEAWERAEVLGIKESVFMLRAFSKIQRSLWKVVCTSEQVSRNGPWSQAERAATWFQIHFLVYYRYSAVAILCF